MNAVSTVNSVSPVNLVKNLGNIVKFGQVPGVSPTHAYGAPLACEQTG